MEEIDSDKNALFFSDYQKFVVEIALGYARLH